MASYSVDDEAAGELDENQRALPGKLTASSPDIAGTSCITNDKGDGIHNPYLDQDVRPLGLTEADIDDVVAFLVFANAGISQLAPFGSVDEKFFGLDFDVRVRFAFSDTLFRFR